MPSGTVDDSNQAEVSSPIACASCREPVADRYFEINRTIVCEPCRHSIEAQLRGGPGFGRFARAALLGLGASIAGTALYSAFLSFSSYDWTLVAVLIGYVVGKVVRKGSGGLGGLAYQMLAVGLTYLSLGMAYFTLMLLAIWRQNQLARPIELAPGTVLQVLGQALQLPVLEMKDSPVRIAFVGFGLWMAWKLNRPGQFVVTGPHQVDEVGGASSLA
jgi:hypothetical protein